MFWFKLCPRCRGDLYLAEGTGELVTFCVQCGYEPSEATLRQLVLLNAVETRGERETELAAAVHGTGSRPAMRRPVRERVAISVGVPVHHGETGL